MYAKIGNGKTAYAQIEDDKGIGMYNIEITANDYLEGEIEIFEHSKKPEKCVLPDINRGHKIYKIIEINHTFENDKMQEVKMKILVNNEWMNINEMEDIAIYECYPKSKKLYTEVIKENNFEYLVSSDEFSTWAIVALDGISENQSMQKDKLKIINSKMNFSKIKIFTLSTIISFIILSSIAFLSNKIIIYWKKKRKFPFGKKKKKSKKKLKSREHFREKITNIKKMAK